MCCSSPIREVFSTGPTNARIFRQAKGLALINFIDLRPEERVTTLITARQFEEHRHLMMITRRGIIKKTPVSAFENIRRSGLIAVNLMPDDELVGVVRVEKGNIVMVNSAQGQAILFEEEQVRPMGRTAAGVRAINLDKGNYVIGLDKIREALMYSSLPKRIRQTGTIVGVQDPAPGRQRRESIELTRKNGDVVASKIVSAEDELVIRTSEGQIIRLEVEDISVQKRYAGEYC
jgi:DNA gyrase subunit A